MPIAVTITQRTGRLLRGLILVVIALAWPTWASDNLIEIDEQFYRLSYDIDSGEYRRTPVEEARPGELLELRISAVNRGTGTARNLDLVNSVPTDSSGRSLLVAQSFRIDESLGEFRLSSNGETFFPAGVEMPAEEVRFVQWLIYALPAGEQVEFSYRLSIPR
ncbi:MAG: hypothetical protein ACX931_01780 [Saccharospirillum sp.]